MSADGLGDRRSDGLNEVNGSHSPSDSADPLTFHLVPTVGQSVYFFSEIAQHLFFTYKILKLINSIELDFSEGC